jgi:predicted metal-dependent hydrolase
MVLPSNYSIERKQVKHIRIRVSANNAVRIIVPLDFSEDEITSLLDRKKKWIEEKIHSFSNKYEKISLAPNQILLNGERYRYIYWKKLGRRVNVNHQHRNIQSGINLLDPIEQLSWYRKLALTILPSRVKEIAKKYHYTFNRVYIRNQTTKWGNCSSKKNISLNWRLIKTPEFVVDYVILHELIHTAILNHTQQFWIRLRSLNPDYKHALDWLDKFDNL